MTISTDSGWKIDAAAIAEGLLKLFTHQERQILRLGMLPAAIMHKLEECLIEKFGEIARDQVEKKYQWRPKSPINKQSTECRNFVRECSHAVTVELYRQGDLVV